MNSRAGGRPQRLRDHDEEEEGIELHPVGASGGEAAGAPQQAPRSTWAVRLFVLFAVVACTALIIAAVSVDASGSASDADADTGEVSEEQVLECLETNRPAAAAEIFADAVEHVGSDPVLFRDVTVWVGDGETVLERQDVLVDGGKIVAMGDHPLIGGPDDAVEIDCSDGDFVLSPGLVDMHSHAGVYSWPEIWATADGNEMTKPIYPQVRALDAFDPEDPALGLIRSGGVTTIQVLPGSGNNMGGEGFVMKLMDGTVNDMIIPDAPRLLKHACGENPKHTHASGVGRAESRMGSAWLMREAYEKASKLVAAQDSFCSSSSSSSSTTSEAEDFPSDLSLDSLVALLRGEARLHVHCYQVHDLQMMMRLSDEFDFSISAFHHGLEAYKVPELIRERDITVATFSDLWGYKFEAYDASVYSPMLLDEAGVKVALKSDHPVTNSKDLMLEAAKAHHWGLDAQAALAAVTSVPANAVGVGHRTGKVEVGLDGDLVLWDRQPLALGAQPVKVLINGAVMVDNAMPSAAPVAPVASDELVVSLGDGDTYVVTGVTLFPGGDDEAIEGATLVVSDGIVTCVDAMLACPVPSDATVYSLQGGSVMPGLVESTSHIGLYEIGAEADARDGFLSDVTGADGSTAQIRAIDGVRFRSRHVSAAWAAGVTTAVAIPMSYGLVTGLSSAFYTAPGAVALSNDSIVAEELLLHVALGSDARDSGLTASVSGQVAALRKLLAADDELADVLTGERPLAVYANQVDQIAAALRLAAAASPSVRLVVVGGAEAHLLADELAAASVPVLLEARRFPDSMESWYADDASATTLVDAGVLVGLGMWDPDNGRNLRFEAGLAAEHGLTTQQAVRAVTTSVAEVFGLEDAVGRIAVGRQANFVAVDADQPLSLQGQVALVGLGARVDQYPQQFVSELGQELRMF